MNPRLRRPGLMRTLLLAVCLLAAQWVGALHRVDHGGVVAAHAAAAVSSNSHEGHAPGSAECLLIDHALAQADAWLPVLLLAFVALRHIAPDTTAPAAVDAAAAFAYLARGPPADRV